MPSVRAHHTVAEIDPRDWTPLGGSTPLNTSHAYLEFREHVEPGATVVLTAENEGRLCGALHGSLTTPQTKLFSHPWKMLTDVQFLHAEKDELPELGARQTALTSRIASTDRAGGPNAEDFTTALGEAVVIRGFDTSEVLLLKDLDPTRSADVAHSLVAQLRLDVQDGLAGAVVFPFVDPADEVLRHVLTTNGFRSGTLTAITYFDLTPFDSYEAFLAALSRGRRWNFQNEQRRLVKSGYECSTVRLADTVRRIAELEAMNAKKYGGDADVLALSDLRLIMAQKLDGAVRVPVAQQGEKIIACGIHLVDDENYQVLMYGCDYTEDDRSTAYQCINFYDPLRYALGRGLRQVRLGMEAFVPKLLRGAQLAERQTWAWSPDAARLDALADLLTFYRECNTTYFQRLRGLAGAG